MNKIFDFLDFIIIFAAGVTFSMVVSAMIYSVGAPRIIIVIALALLVIIAASFSAYALGRRREKMSCQIAYNKGVQHGRRIGRAEQRSEVDKFLD